jgi:hypothetical protein
MTSIARSPSKNPLIAPLEIVMGTQLTVTQDIHQGSLTSEPRVHDATAPFLFLSLDFQFLLCVHPLQVGEC